MKPCVFPSAPVNAHVAYAGEQTLQGCLGWTDWLEIDRRHPKAGSLIRRYANASPWIAVFVRRAKQR